MQPCQLCLDAAVENGVTNASHNAAPQGRVHLDLDVDPTAGVCRQALLQTLDLITGELNGTPDLGGGNTSALVKHLKCGIDDCSEQTHPLTLSHHLQEIERQAVDFAIKECHQRSRCGSAIDEAIAQKLLQIRRIGDGYLQACKIARHSLCNAGSAAASSNVTAYRLTTSGAVVDDMTESCRSVAINSVRQADRR